MDKTVFLNVFLIVAVAAILWNLGAALYHLLRGSKLSPTATNSQNLSPFSQRLLWRIALSLLLLIVLWILALLRPL